MTDLWICVHALCPPWEISRDNGSNSTRKFAHSLKFEVFEIISLIGLVFSTMEHYTCELFCCLACDCNYRDEKLCDVNFTSRLFCTRQILFSKLLDVLEVFWNFYVHNPSHKIKQRAKFQTEMLSRIAKTAILIKRSIIGSDHWRAFEF